MAQLVNPKIKEWKAAAFAALEAGEITATPAQGSMVYVDYPALSDEDMTLVGLLHATNYFTEADITESGVTGGTRAIAFVQHQYDNFLREARKDKYQQTAVKAYKAGQVTFHP